MAENNFIILHCLDSSLINSIINFLKTNFIKLFIKKWKKFLFSNMKNKNLLSFKISTKPHFLNSKDQQNLKNNKHFHLQELGSIRHFTNMQNIRKEIIMYFQVE